ncbi:hypothetical protein BD626DRAFT_475946 [Schizophyllum amplum]|uniref:Uncharacterized protein n=1 Tax=Schizophyllum amplum TaxID=97359 RepID=A0A550CYY8_9AGAR|nr:hypothetical protein BD626DRAFT_475946 [Auriculariopsis ampla]
MLGAENAQLNAHRQRLQDTVAQHTSRFGTLNVPEELSPVNSSTPRRHTADLPPEILLLIFKRSIAPAFLVSPAYSVYEEPWLECMQTKQNLSLVCRTWQQAVTELLYEDVGFRSIGQLAALLDTLIKKPDLAYLVRSIIVACYIPPFAISAYIGDLLSILGMCRRLHTFSFCNHDVNQNHVFPLQVRPTSLFAHIVNLHFAERPESLQDLLPLLTNMSPRLQSLRLVITDSDLTLAPGLTFQVMTTLSLTMPWLSPGRSLAVIRNWLMPRVESVTFRMSQYLYSSSITPGAALEEDAFQTFANQNGSHIRYLQVQTRRDYEDSNILGFNVQPMLQSCPLLEHLVLPANMRHPISHPTLRWIDVWEPPTSRRRSPNFWRKVDKLTTAVFPCLRGVRTIDHSLSFMMDLPHVIDPDVRAALGTPVVAFEYPGVRIKVAERRIWRADDVDDFPVDYDADNLYQDGDEARQEVNQDEQGDELDGVQTRAERQQAEEDDDIDDPDFEPVSSPPTTPVSTASSSVSSCVTTDNEDAEQMLQWTHDDVLRAFRQRNTMPFSSRSFSR